MVEVRLCCDTYCVVILGDGDNKGEQNMGVELEM